MLALRMVLDNTIARSFRLTTIGVGGLRFQCALTTYSRFPHQKPVRSILLRPGTAAYLLLSFNYPLTSLPTVVIFPENAHHILALLPLIPLGMFSVLSDCIVSAVSSHLARFAGNNTPHPTELLGHSLSPAQGCAPAKTASALCPQRPA